MQYPNKTATEAYYSKFAQRHGFADHELRGHGHSIIPVRPVSDYIEAPSNNADIYCKNGHRNGNGAVTHGTSAETQRRIAARQLRSVELLEQLGRLVPMVKARIELRPMCAARDALRDAQFILTGEQPVFGANRITVLTSLIAILARYA